MSNMGRLTFKHMPEDWFENKLVLKSPSQPPPGYKYLATHSEPIARFIKDYKYYKAAENSPDKDLLHFIGSGPTHWVDQYDEFDIYEKLPADYMPKQHTVTVNHRITVDDDIIINGYEITNYRGTEHSPTIEVLKDGMRRALNAKIEGQYIKIENLDKYRGYLAYVNYQYTYEE